MTTLQRDEAALTTQLILGPLSNKMHDVKVLILNMVATSNMISCSYSHISCMTDSVQLCHIQVAEFTTWHTSLGRKLIPPSCMPTCAASHQKTAYRSNPSRPSLVWNLLRLAIVALMRCFPPCYYPAFLQLNNIDEMENILCQHGIASWSRLNEDYIW
jgi:hypothetical protein